MITPRVPQANREENSLCIANAMVAKFLMTTNRKRLLKNEVVPFQSSPILINFF